jgi:hypothetical protein
MYSVFISYSSHELDIVNHVRTNLVALGVEVFVAEYSVTIGEKLRCKIEGAIQDCDLFILLWSKNAKTSDWVTDELAMARKAGKFVMPVVLESDLQLPPFISEMKYLKAYRPKEEWLPALKEMVFKRVEKDRNAVLALLGGILLAALVFEKKSS